MFQNPAGDSNVARAGAARRRRERRLRAMLRHERQTVAMELAAALHHSRNGGRETYYGLRAPKTASSGGRRPGVLKEPEPPNVVERVLRHTVDQIVVAVPLVPLLDDPVPQMVDTVLEFFRALDLPVGEQVIAVPKISTDRVSQRLVERRLPHIVEQLVEVPTVLTPTRIALQIAEQIVDTPVPRGRGEGRVQGFLPRQSSTATPSAEERISERIVQQFSPSSAKRTSERIEEQLVDTSPGVGLGQGSSSSAGPADEDFAEFFRTFPSGKKVRVPPRVRVRSCPERSAHGLRRLMPRPSVPTSGCSSPSRANPSTGTDAPTRPAGLHLRASRLSGSASSLLQGGFGTGTRKRVSVLMTSHLFLLADWSRCEGLGIPSHLHGCHTRRRQRRHVQGWCCWSLPLRAVLLPVCARPRCLTSWSVWTRRTLVQCTGFCWWLFSSFYVPFS